ncbi:MAG: hypothetical protein A3E36_04735 [Candidatus Andersenbacteria bacterium RIFCSPHIGHO2_12_FULL_45_11b]|uniref:DUF7793 domain-containing protein n=1 Tax=Candidatus Andersenbacteria bacterium RIFCSPHIGHO2_12_FULL_45_11b TaxID=1797282 RepID=A0A1G1XC95_9BACT|nr:MAG: hypothetical protein A3E36_04735 [Candidatus Andersenbacteria bacterium RIFCSPHIGHO2_12_FULL_45_11b]
MHKKASVGDSIILEEIQPTIMALRFYKLEKDPVLSAQQAQQFEKMIIELYMSNPGAIFDYIIDGSRVSSSKSISPQARKFYKRVYGMPQTGRIAYVGLGAWLKLMTGIFSHVVNRKSPTQWFQDEAEALAWLEEQS